MDKHLQFELIEARLSRILAQFRHLRESSMCLRPFVLEFFGTPKAGKTTIMSAVEHFLKRSDWRVTARPEGAEAVDQLRDTPQYNEETWRYAMSEVYCRLRGPFEIVMLDRGLMDNLIWMDYWRKKGKMSAEEQGLGEAFKLTPLYRNMFDLHICMVCEPETAMERELAHAISKKDGETMNLSSLRSLRESHDKLWGRVGGSNDVRMLWRDSSKDTPAETAFFVLTKIADAFERRIGCIE